MRLLLDADMDPQETNSEGLRTAHYLLGLGPMAASLVLSAEAALCPLRSFRTSLVREGSSPLSFGSE